MGRTGLCKVGRHIVTFEQVLMTNVKYVPWGEAEEGSLMSSIFAWLCVLGHIARTTNTLIFIHQFAGLFLQSPKKKNALSSVLVPHGVPVCRTLSRRVL